ncbi:MAG: radical SAM protein [Candidatus Pacebacteria bacterium]|nr:radical SAM protein [Candidatus Paceibacterota bacterium]
MFNSGQRAQALRKNLIKDGKYLLAKIGGAGQDPGERKVLTDYFRFKDYIDKPSWANSSEKEKRSEKYLGLDENGFKKTEFQNPTYSASYSLKRNLREFSKVFTMQVAGCNYVCNYCFVPRELNSGSEKYGRFFSAEEIVDEFLKIKEQSETPMNVIRISGGECMIVPELIVDVYEEMMKKSPDSYLWVDINLSTLEIIKNQKKPLQKVLSQKNVGVVGCFKGTAKEDFSIITGAEEKFYQEQFETAKLLIDLGADFYAYVPAYVYDENLAEEKLEGFLLELQKINKNLPLRLEMLKIENFPAAKINFELAKKEGRAIPNTSQKLIFDLWYNKLLPKYYLKSDLKKFCCEIEL